MQLYSSRTDTLLHVPVQPVIVLHTLSSKCHITPQTSNFHQSRKCKVKKWRRDLSSLLLSPPLYLQPVPSTVACTSKFPDNRILGLIHGQNFIRPILLGAKLLAHSFLLTTSYVVLLIIKAQFLGIVQSEHNSYPSCFTTLYS